MTSVRVVGAKANNRPSPSTHDDVKRIEIDATEPFFISNRNRSTSIYHTNPESISIIIILSKNVCNPSISQSNPQEQQLHL